MSDFSPELASYPDLVEEYELLRGQTLREAPMPIGATAIAALEYWNEVTAAAAERGLEAGLYEKLKRVAEADQRDINGITVTSYYANRGDAGMADVPFARLWNAIEGVTHD